MMLIYSIYSLYFWIFIDRIIY